MKKITLATLSLCLLTSCADTRGSIDYYTVRPEDQKEYKRYIESFEGNKNYCYLDSNNNWTVGIGHKLLKGLELDSKGQPIHSYYSSSIIDSLFNDDLEITLRAVKKQYPSFSTQPRLIQLILIDAAFQLGPTGFSKFVNFHKHIEEHNYHLAAEDLKSSLYYQQDHSGHRAKAHYAALISWFDSKKTLQ